MRSEIDARSDEAGRAERWLGFILRVSQGGPYLLMVHAIPDALCDAIRRLRVLWRARTAVPLSNDRHASRRAA